MSPQARIHVDRCTVTVRRRDGWSWGDPHELLDGVLAAIEQALATAAEETGVEPDEDVVLTGPVRLLVGRDGSVAPAPGSESLADRLTSSRGRQRSAPPERPPPAQGREQSAWPAAPEPDEVPVPELGAVVLAHGLAVALERLSRGGALARVLATSPRPLLVGWLELLVRSCAATADPRPWPDEALEAVARRVIGSTEAATLAAEGRVLLVAGALVAAAGGRLPASDVIERLRRATEAASVAGADHPDPADASRSTAPLPPVPTAAVAPRPDRSVARQQEDPGASAPIGAAVVPALPFLVLLQLQRLDYLAPAAAVLHLAGANHAGRPEGLVGADRALAAMLAGKVLPPPAGGWRREGAERDAVALVAGLAPRQVDELVDRWAGPARDAVPALDALLAVMDERDADRSEPGESALTAHRGLPGLEADDFERHLAAAVGTALGQLAVELWGEEADALLALTRLEDLQARVVVTDREVSIGLPRGQRWLDLRRIGLLDVWSMPWAAGGRWELVTW